ncbi:MAG: hypothetical protein IPJ89_02370 [Candidatus Iainarchaeum archaeon]|uniref:Uncharacterized protein n=1 Tax=Candidatus Iainarchaeum sp. TaxID=3101447 RepID=A0A7T9I1I7_9ARCH|nr:MAG: hypothetical protein IPJ89_02370 [Candidatus Diapherotrites archaeon]
MMRFLLLSLAIVSLFAFVAAEPIDWKTADCHAIALQQKTFDLVQLVNNKHSFAFADGEIVNLTVFREGAPFQMAGKISSGVVSEFQCGPRDDATMVITIPQQAIEQIYASDDQIKTFAALRTQGSIRIEPISVSAMIRVAVVDFGIRLYQLLGIKLFFG